MDGRSTTPNRRPPTEYHSYQYQNQYTLFYTKVVIVGVDRPWYRLRYTHRALPFHCNGLPSPISDIALSTASGRSTCLIGGFHYKVSGLPDPARFVFAILALFPPSNGGVPGIGAVVTVHRVSNGQIELFQTQPGIRESKFGVGGEFQVFAWYGGDGVASVYPAFETQMDAARVGCVYTR